MQKRNTLNQIGWCTIKRWKRPRFVRIPDYVCSQIKEYDFTCVCTLTKNPIYMQPTRRLGVINSYVSLSDKCQRCQSKSNRISLISTYEYRIPEKSTGAACNSNCVILSDCLHCRFTCMTVELFHRITFYSLEEKLMCARWVLSLIRTDLIQIILKE